VAKPKKVNFRVLDRKDHDGQEPYRIMDDYVRRFHRHLEGARIALAWKFNVKPNRDGQLCLGKARKAADLDRALHEYDFVIFLTRSAWDEMQSAQREALVDHELAHCEVVREKDGSVKEDEDGRTVYRIKRHDVEEFQAVIERHGLYKKDLEEFVEAARQKKDQPLLRVTGTD
jgi:hypothetical protein